MTCSPSAISAYFVHALLACGLLSQGASSLSLVVEDAAKPIGRAKHAAARAVEHSAKQQAKPVAKPATTLAVKQTANKSPSKDDLHVDWMEFIAGHDLQWTNKQLPSNWRDSAFVGNGRLGAMVWVDAGDTHQLHVEVGASDLFDNLQPGSELAVSPDDAVCNRPRLPLGRFFFKLPGPPENFKMRLRLYDAEVKGVIGNRFGNMTFRILAASEPDVLVMRTSARGEFANDPEPWKWQPADLTKMPQGCVAKRWSRTPAARTRSVDNVSVWEQTHLGGTSHAVAFGYAAGRPGETVFVASASGVKADEAAVEDAVGPVRRAKQMNVDVITRNHQAWWHDFYPRGAFLSLGDKTLENFYWVNMYKAASASRPGRPLYDLQGPWPVEGTPWPDVHWDLNIQLTYMPFAAAGRLDLLESLWEFLERNLGNLISNVPPKWRYDSAAAPSLASSADAKASCNAKQWGGSTLRQAATCVVSPPGITGNLLWTLQVLHGAYDVTKDPKYAKRLYPLLRRAVNFHMHLQEEGEDGKLHLPAAMSPEYGAPGRVPVQQDPNYDLALYRWGLQAVLDMCDGVAKDMCANDPGRGGWADSLQRLAPFPRHEEEGYTIYRGQRLEESHRHFSHLLMFYPLRLTDAASQEDRDVARRSLDHWVSKAGRLQGYSFIAASAMSTLLDRPEAAMGNLSHLIHKFISPNSFYSEGGTSRPVAETPMFAATAIQELLLAPTRDELRLFAGVPPALKEASFFGLRAPGGVKVSAARVNGTTAFVVVEGAAEGGTNASAATVTLRPGFAAGARVRFERPKGASVEITEGEHTSDGATRVRVSPLSAGARVLLWPLTSKGQGKPDFRVAAI